MTYHFDDLPDDDEQAFAVLEQRERQKLQERVDKLEERWPISQAQFDYVNAVWALANAAGIEVLAQYPIVMFNDGGFDEHYAQFSAHAQRVVYDISFRAARAKQKDAVELSAAAKGKLHSLIAKIREVIEGANLEEEKKRALLDRVGELAKEVDRPRTQLRVALNMLLDVSATVGEAAENLTPLRKLADMVIDIFAIARQEEPKRLPGTPKRISDKPAVKTAEKRASPIETFNQDLDDEIPF